MRFEVKRYTSFPGGNEWTVYIGPFSWSTWDWGLSKQDPSHANTYLGLFSLKCGECREFVLGCVDHWFCGICQPCKDGIEETE